MKYFWHFLQSNIKYNKLELAISYGLTILFHIAYVYMQDISLVKSKKPDSGEMFISVAFYATLYVYYTNKRKTHIKYYLSLPLSKAKLLLNKVLSEFVFFIPAIYLINMAALYSKFEIHHLGLTIILLLVSVVVSLFLFDSAVEEPRLENAKASFMNRLVYVRKSMDFLFRFVAVGYIAAAIYILQIDVLLKEYMIVLLLGVVIFFKFQNSLRLIQDESLSYFIPKRDMVRAGWKFGFLLVPLLVLKPATDYLSHYGDNELVEYIVQGQQEKIADYYHSGGKWDVILKNNFTPTLVAIKHGRLDILDFMIKNGATVPSNKPVKGFGVEGMKAIHLAVLSGNVDMVSYLAKNFPETKIAILDENEYTALHLAIQKCSGKMIDRLIKEEIELNARNDEGQTPIMQAAARSKCYYGVVALSEANADITIVDKAGESIFDYLRNSSFRYFVEKKYPNQYGRYLASKKDSETDEISVEVPVTSLEQPLQQKR